MKDFYTLNEMASFPGINNTFIHKAVGDLNLPAPEKHLIFGRKTTVYPRATLERILQHNGYELVNIDGVGHWVKFRVKDF